MQQESSGVWLFVEQPNSGHTAGIPVWYLQERLHRWTTTSKTKLRSMIFYASCTHVILHFLAGRFRTAAGRLTPFFTVFFLTFFCPISCGRLRGSSDPLCLFLGSRGISHSCATPGDSNVPLAESDWNNKKNNWSKKLFCNDFILIIRIHLSEIGWTLGLRVVELLQSQFAHGLAHFQTIREKTSYLAASQHKTRFASLVLRKIHKGVEDLHDW